MPQTKRWLKIEYRIGSLIITASGCFQICGVKDDDVVVADTLQELTCHLEYRIAPPN